MTRGFIITLVNLAQNLKARHIPMQWVMARTAPIHSLTVRSDKWSYYAVKASSCKTTKQLSTVKQYQHCNHHSSSTDQMIPIIPFGLTADKQFKMQRPINHPSGSPQPTNQDVNNLAWTTGGLLEAVKWCVTTNHTLINVFHDLEREMKVEIENNVLYSDFLAGFSGITVCCSVSMMQKSCLEF